MQIAFRHEKRGIMQSATMMTNYSKKDMDREIQVKHYDWRIHPKIKKLIGLRLLDEKREREITVSTTMEAALLYNLEMFGQEIPDIHLHDVLRAAIVGLDGKVIKAVIHNVIDGEFRSHLCIATPENDFFTVDICPTDALSIALREKVPVYIMESVFEKDRTQRNKVLYWHEINRDDALEVLNRATPEKLQQQSPEELDIFLEKAIEAEDYELAKKLRTVIEKMVSGCISE